MSLKRQVDLDQVKAKLAGHHATPVAHFDAQRLNPLPADLHTRPEFKKAVKELRDAENRFTPCFE